jgi:hypothetical protein
MNTLDQIRIITIPYWLRITAFALLALALFGNIAIILLGFLEEPGTKRFEFWIPSGAALLSVTLPLVGIVTLFGFANTGVVALQARTKRFLVKTIPYQLARLETVPPTWSEWDTVRGAAAKKHVSKSRIQVSVLHGDCIAEYKVLLPQNQIAGQPAGEIMLRVELNVRRVNVAIKLPMPADDCSEARKIWPHTIVGATGAGWALNESVSQASSNDLSAAVVELVFFRALEPDFLWDVAAQLYLSQDIRLMLAAMAAEAPIHHAQFSVAGRSQ